MKNKLIFFCFLVLALLTMLPNGYGCWVEKIYINGQVSVTDCLDDPLPIGTVPAIPDEGDGSGISPGIDDPALTVPEKEASEEDAVDEEVPCDETSGGVNSDEESLQEEPSDEEEKVNEEETADENETVDEPGASSEILPVGPADGEIEEPSEPTPEIEDETAYQGESFDEGALPVAEEINQ